LFCTLPRTGSPLPREREIVIYEVVNRCNLGGLGSSPVVSFLLGPISNLVFLLSFYCFTFILFY
jgi:hypothetical protein